MKSKPMPKRLSKDRYSAAPERLWEKLEYHRKKLDTECVKYPCSFPADEFSDGNKLFNKLLTETETELACGGMTSHQCGWAVTQFIAGGLKEMKLYNKKNGTNLEARK